MTVLMDYRAGRDLTQPVFAAIQAANTGAQLRVIQRVTIPHTIGISDDERAQLQLAVDLRFGQLNAAATGPQKPRWS